MGLKDLFAKKKDAPPAAAGEVIAETTHAAVVDHQGVAVATILCERYSEHEAKPIEHDLLSAAQRCANRLVIDMSKVAMLASAGIGSLISLHQACVKAGGKMAICGLDDNIAKMLSLTRMDKMLTIVDSPEAAARAVR
ncbi:MAG: anti-sigma factor antagonist [Planctomycetota bacterium]|nr:MAG: anti-sigma factor antagonist [Planctomycetota bacterium]